MGSAIGFGGSLISDITVERVALKGLSSRQEHGVVWQMRNYDRVRWRQPDGTSVSCEEKLKVLDENLAEVRQMCQDAFQDALLMGCDEAQVRQVFVSVITSLNNPYVK
jgi:hypothetical protein